MSAYCKGLSGTVCCVLTHPGSGEGGGFHLAPARQGWCEGGSLGLNYALWVIRIGQLTFAGNYHWLVPVSEFSWASLVKFPKWVKWAIHSSQGITDSVYIVSQ